MPKDELAPRKEALFNNEYNEYKGIPGAVIQDIHAFNNGEGVTDTTNPMNVHPKYVDVHAETHEAALHQAPVDDLRTSANLY